MEVARPGLDVDQIRADLTLPGWRTCDLHIGR